jgi:hypothetical protein
VIDRTPTVAGDFTDRIMTAIARESAPTPTRTFVSAVRARSARDAASTLWVAWHLGTVRGWRIAPGVRVRSIALVLAVTCVLGTGSLAAAAALRVAADPVVNLFQSGVDERGPVENGPSGVDQQREVHDRDSGVNAPDGQNLIDDRSGPDTLVNDPSGSSKGGNTSPGDDKGANHEFGGDKGANESSGSGEAGRDQSDGSKDANQSAGGDPSGTGEPAGGDGVHSDESSPDQPGASDSGDSSDPNPSG